MKTYGAEPDIVIKLFKTSIVSHLLDHLLHISLNPSDFIQSHLVDLLYIMTNYSESIKSYLLLPDISTVE